MGRRHLDRFDREAMNEGQALSDVRKHAGQKRGSGNKRHVYRTQESDLRKTDKGWQALVKKAIEAEL